MATCPAVDVVDVKTGFNMLARPNSLTGQMELSGVWRECLMMRRVGYAYKKGFMVR